MLKLGATIGIIGGGQLGMMTVREAQRIGFRSLVWDPDANCSASRLADEVVAARFADASAAETLARQSDVVTYDFEHIDLAAVAHIETSKRVFPDGNVLRIAQNRRTEKNWLKEHGFPVVDFRIAEDERALQASCAALGFPVVVKTTGAGYDGKGQAVIHSQQEVDRFVLEKINIPHELIVEQYLDLEAELSVIVAREQDGKTWSFPVALNAHRNNILHTSLAPAPFTEEIIDRAVATGRAISEKLDLVGLVCVELFLTNRGDLLVNELAPRPHNSGHYTLDGCSMSQFEALVRTITGLPMCEPELIQPTAIVNVLGKHLERLNLSALHAITGTRLHIYGKTRTEPNRKMGHVSVVRKSVEELLEGVNRIEGILGETVSDFTRFEWGAMNTL